MVVVLVVVVVGAKVVVVVIGAKVVVVVVGARVVVVVVGAKVVVVVVAPSVTVKVNATSSLPWPPLVESGIHSPKAALVISYSLPYQPAYHV